MNKQEEREYWTKLLEDGPVWCEVSESITSTVQPRLVIAYVGGNYPFISVAALGFKNDAIAAFSSGKYNVQPWRHATPVDTILPKHRRPWTAEEIMLHQGCFEVDGFLTRVLCAHNGKVQFAKGPFAIVDILWETVGRFVERSMAVMPDGTRLELYKDGE